MKKEISKLLSLLLITAMLLTMQEIPALGASVTLQSDIESTESVTPVNPVHHCTKDIDNSGNTDITYLSYVSFGSYPQTEVLGDDLTEAIIDASYDENGDAWVDDTKYRRISEDDTNFPGYFGDSTYRYFKWEDIKWRVLQNDGSTLFVVADQGLDCRNYNEEWTSITWEECTLRNWLNDSFYETAFSNSEQNAIVEQTVVNENNSYYGMEDKNNTKDKVYLLSVEEVANPDYGFCEDSDTDSVNRRFQTSDYAHAMGVELSTSDDYAGNCCWWLYSSSSTTGYAPCVYYSGYIYGAGLGVIDKAVAVVPALHINVSSELWSVVDDGSSDIVIEPDNKLESITLDQTQATLEEGENLLLTATISPENATDKTLNWTSSNSSVASVENGLVTAIGKGTAIITAESQDGSEISAQCTITVPEKETEIEETRDNSVHNCSKDTGDDSGDTDTTDWSYVYFGSYPQTEVTGDDLTEAIIEAPYDSNGDAWVDGTKYRRISEDDTNYIGCDFGDSAYRYFKWERIKWRVLQNDDSTLFVVADQGLDCKDYNEELTSIKWESSTLRNWLNDTFYRTAFSSNEQNAIVEQTLVNEDNQYFGTKGGNDTKDNVYLLSYKEAINPDYGFCENYDTYSVSRRLQTSDYAHALGVYNTNDNYAGNCRWWLRSPGSFTDIAAYVNCSGYADWKGVNVNHYNNAVVPALHINLSSEFWFTEDDGTSGEGGSCETDIEPDNKLESITLNHTQATLEKGENLLLTETLSPENATDKTLKWSSKNPSVASVENGMVKAIGKGTAIIIAESQDGSEISAQCTITVTENSSATESVTVQKNPIKNQSTQSDKKQQNTSVTNNSDIKVTNIAIKAISKKIAAGRKVQLSVEVAPANASNQVITWTSSNKNYATVDANGKVTLEKAGAGKTVTITAAATDGSNVQATYVIKIMKHTVKNIKLSKSANDVKAGSSIKLKTTIKTSGNKVNKVLSWNSSNSKYATVNQRGEVRTKKEGKGKTVTITAISTDGTNKKAKIQIKIN